jgi:hypothetical protein
MHVAGGHSGFSASIIGQNVSDVVEYGLPFVMAWQRK